MRNQELLFSDVYQIRTGGTDKRPPSRREPAATNRIVPETFGISDRLSPKKTNTSATKSTFSRGELRGRMSDINSGESLRAWLTA